MVTACLVVQRNSLNYIKRVVEAFHLSLCDVFGKETPLIISDEVDLVNFSDENIIFIIGESFKRFIRKKECKYVYINFSVISFLGNPFNLSRKTITHIRYKRRIFLEKIDLFDAVIDYYPAQTYALKNKIKTRLYGFIPYTLPFKVLIKKDKIYDTCFVGEMSHRRKTVLQRLISEGVVLSPTSGATIENYAAQSKLTLNIHMHRSNHLEIPRILGAISVASALLTERSYGINDVLDQDIVKVASYRHIVQNTIKLLRDSNSTHQIGLAARVWYESTFIPRQQQKNRDMLLKISKEVFS